MLDMVRDKKAHGNIQLETITPTIAAAWLDKNKNNRKQQKRFIDQYARDIKDGNWSVTGDAIKFDKHGNLLDGQHRLQACIKAEKSFDTYVIYGLPEAIKDVVDTGKSRSIKDVLSMRGVPNASIVGGTFKLLINEKRGTSNIGGNGTVTHSELLAAEKKHPNLYLYVPSPGTLPKGISLQLVGYINYVGGHLLGKKSRASAFIEVLKTGVPDYDGDPVHKFRERAMRERVENVATIPGRMRTIWTLKHCWNLFARREAIEQIRWQKEDVDIVGLDSDKL